MRTWSILLVDDDYEFHRDLEAVLPRGYRLLSAYNPSGALETMRSGSPDVVLLSLYLPSTTGVDESAAAQSLLEQMIELGGREIPIFVMAEDKETSHADQCMSFGARGIVSKSAGVGALLRQIEQSPPPVAGPRGNRS